MLIGSKQACKKMIGAEYRIELDSVGSGSNMKNRLAAEKRLQILIAELPHKLH